jgi:uncharacterized phiE125 gp8 family phage protein
MLRDIRWEDVCLVPPAVEPVSLETVRAQRRIADTALDARLEAWREAARQHFEEETGLQLITATRQFSMECFPVQPAICVGRAPVQTILSVSYVNASLVRQELDPARYELFPQREILEPSPPIRPPSGPYPTPGGIQLVPGASWPISADRAGAVWIVYTAGFADDPSGVPEILQYALLQYLGDFQRWAENQTESSVAVLPMGTTMVRRQATGMMVTTRRLTRW